MSKTANEHCLTPKMRAVFSDFGIDLSPETQADFIHALMEAMPKAGQEETEADKTLDTHIARVWRQVYGSSRFDKRSIEYEFAVKLLDGLSKLEADNALLREKLEQAMQWNWLDADIEEFVDINEFDQAISRTASDSYVEVQKLRAMVSAREAEVAHWKNNHEAEVRRARVLKERTDMPLERVQAYDKWGEDLETISRLEREKRCAVWGLSETVRAACKTARLMLDVHGHEVVCVEPHLWLAITSIHPVSTLNSYAAERVDQYRVDAERYRWLRSQHWEEAPMCVVMQPKAAVKLGYDCPSLGRLDVAIDAARSTPSEEAV